MFEHARDYPAAVTQDGGGDQNGSQRSAITWVARKQQELGGTVLLYVPQKSSLERNDSLLARFGKQGGVVVGTWRGFVSGWSGGPVLAAWPSREKLAEIADDRRTRALCVVPWNDSDAAAWERATGPERLDGAPSASRPVALDPVVVVGLTHLTHMVNHSNNLAGSLDHRDAVAVLRTLHKGGYALPADEVYTWALGNGWPARGAERLREMAAKIDAGKTVQLKGESPLRANVLDLWRTEAKSGGA